MKLLQDYTTEELKAEIKRRLAEERKVRNANRDRKAKFLYALALVTQVTEGAFCRRRWKVELTEEYKKLYGADPSPMYVDVMRSIIKSTDSPEVGDIVRLKKRITNASPTWRTSVFQTPQICGIEKKADIKTN